VPHPCDISLPQGAKPAKSSSKSPQKHPLRYHCVYRE
jgi:hypothetical protein